MDTQSRFGKQPFRAILKVEGRSIGGTGQALGFDGGYTLRVANGRVRPSGDFIEGLCTLLGREKAELFTAEALAKPYFSNSNAVGLRRVEDGTR